MPRVGRSSSPPHPTESNTIPTSRLDALENLMGDKQRALQLQKQSRGSKKGLVGRMRKSKSAVISVEANHGEGTRTPREEQSSSSVEDEQEKLDSPTTSPYKTGEDGESIDDQAGGHDQADDDDHADHQHLEHTSEQQQPLPTPTTPFPLDLLFQQFSSTPLSSLDLSSWTNHLTIPTLDLISHHNPNLTSLTFKDCLLTDSELDNALKTYNGITSLYLSSLPLLTRSFPMLSILDNVPLHSSLKSLTLRSLPSLTPQFLVRAARCLAPTLRSIDISHNPQLTDDSVLALTKTCTRLTSLDVSFLTNLTERGCVGMHTCLSQSLKCIWLTGCGKVTNSTVGEIFAQCGERLVEVGIVGVGEVDDEGVRCLEEVEVVFGRKKNGSGGKGVDIFEMGEVSLMLAFVC